MLAMLGHLEVGLACVLLVPKNKIISKGMPSKLTASFPLLRHYKLDLRARWCWHKLSHVWHDSGKLAIYRLGVLGSPFKEVKVRTNQICILGVRLVTEILWWSRTGRNKCHF